MAGPKFDKASAIKFIDKQGFSLVFPIDNARDPLSLWYYFFPRSPMRWEWDDNGDSRVAGLWHLREELSRSGKVVYAKWFRGRATFFSRTLFVKLLSAAGSTKTHPAELGPDAVQLLRTLEESSPLSTKQLKRAADMEGKFFQKNFDKGMKELWDRFLVVGYGEVDDGAFPSLAVGATSLMFEAEWKQAQHLSPVTARAAVEAALKPHDKVLRYWTQRQKKFPQPGSPVSLSW